ncbi:MAG: type II toxin-antitoxin system RelE/ParE family toxin [Mediterranea sp.]|jgi:plasmid stabilization system protein ParE|nr:type II toxin-antitoxin system RelE/ParE family toxin [Mediterranea sp.]
MDALKIVWTEKAENQMEDIVVWYDKKMGRQTAAKVTRDILRVVTTLSVSPRIGILDTSFARKGYECRSVLFHPKYRILYCFNSKELRIRGFQAMESGQQR